MTDRSDGPPTCFASVGDGGDSEDNNVTVNTSTEEHRLKYAIVKSIFEAIELHCKHKNRCFFEHNCRPAMLCTLHVLQGEKY